jgi:hypothetical protein
VNESILNIGAGKPDLGIDISQNFIINLDRNYFTSVHPSYAESKHYQWLCGKIDYCTLDVKYDIFEFLKTYKYKFDKVLIYRYLEHIPKDQLLFFVYLLSTVVETNGLVDVVSPDFRSLAQMILDEDVNDPNFDKNDIILSTEIFNEAYDPHQNITTSHRTKRLFEYEGRFEVIESCKYKYDGRDIYFRSLIRRK